MIDLSNVCVKEKSDTSNLYTWDFSKEEDDEEDH